MGSGNRATIRSLRALPLRHKYAILCRNMAETSLLTGDVLRTVVQTDDRRCRKIDKLMKEKFSLEQEIKELMFENDSTIEISSQMKADVEMVMGENQTLEKKNEELENKNEEMKFALEGEKNKAQTLEKKVKELQWTLEKEKDENKKKETKLVASHKKNQELLKRKMDLDTSLFERKQENKKLQTSLTQNGFKIGIAQVQELLMDDDELIPELEKMKINPKVKYEKETIPSIGGEPTIWSENYEADPMKYIKEWGIEADVPLDPPCPVKIVRPTPPITAPEAPSTSASDVPSQVPSTDPPLSGQNVPPPHPDISSGDAA
ncbi:hypothetical protein Dimus_031761 [Dionaea muscipula]